MDAIELMREVIDQKTIFAGIGNSMRGDDGFGPYFINKLKEKKLLPEDFLLAVEDVPENFAFPIARKSAENVIFVDAVIVNASPGSVVFGPLEEFDEVGEIASTHRMSLKLTARIIEETGKKVYILGVVPETTEFGRGMTPLVTGVADELVNLVAELIYEKIHGPVNNQDVTGSSGTGEQKKEKV